MLMRRIPSRAWTGLGILATIAVLATLPAHAEVSLAGIGMGHGAPTAASFRQFQALVRQYNASGERFRIDMRCPSACTMFLAIRNACITSNASLAFHAGGDARYGGPNTYYTSQMLNTYKPALRKYLIRNHYMERFEFHTISGDDMVRRFGYAACR